jgi:DNA polymerase delta subunit 1
MFENGSITYPRGVEGTFESVTYESNLPYALRFMIDNEIVGMSWIKIPAGRYRPRLTPDKLCNT